VFYPQLFESPFNTLNPDGGMFNGKMLDYLDDEAYPFAVDIKTGDVVMGDAGTDHGAMAHSTSYNHEGRIWIDSEVIVFWNNQPEKYILEKIINKLSYNFSYDVKNFPIFPKRNEHVDWFNEPDLRKKHIERWKERQIRKNKENKQYSDSGFGSSHPKYQEIQKQKRLQPFEGFYPNLK